MPGDGVHITLVCEDEAHRSLAVELADRVLVRDALDRGADWIDAEGLAHLRSYLGPPDSDVGYYSMPQVKQAAEGLGKTVTVGGRAIRLRGSIDGQPLGPAAGFWRRVLLYLATRRPRPELLIIVRDTDGDLAQHSGLHQALPLLGGELPVIVATPHQDAEAWFVAGFVPENDHERANHRACCAALGFDPCEEPHRLTARPNEAVTDAKRVLRRLLFDEDRSRPPARTELPALCERTMQDLRLLERRGDACRLAAFLADLRRVLVPLFIPGPPG